MDRKKAAALLVSAVMSLAVLTACGDSSSGADSAAASSASSQAVSSKAEEKPKEYDTTVFTVSVPSGWTAAAVPDLLKQYDGVTNPDQVYVLKGGKTAEEIYRYPYVWICYYKDAGKYASARSMYDDTQDISVTTGARNWEGYTYNSSGYPGACLTCKEGESLWVCLFVLENGENKITLQDSDVSTLLSSLKAK